MNDKIYRWNAGWFGMQLGGSLWMIGTLFIGAPIFSLAALSGLIICVLVNTAGTLFWLNRHKLDCYISFQILLVIQCLAAFALLAIMDISQYLQQWEPRLKQPWHAYLFLVMYPALSVMFYFQNKQLKNVRTEDQMNK